MTKKDVIFILRRLRNRSLCFFRMGLYLMLAVQQMLFLQNTASVPDRLHGQAGDGNNNLFLLDHSGHTRFQHPFLLAALAFANLFCPLADSKFFVPTTFCAFTYPMTAVEKMNGKKQKHPDTDQSNLYLGGMWLDGLKMEKVS